MSDTLIGKKLGDYIIQELLGRGGMAHVYRGLDPNLQRFAAVKVIDSRLLAKGHEEEYRARFRREARAIARLTQPNIVGVYQFGEFGPLYYMAMEFIDGQDLHFVLKLKAASGEKLSRAQVLRIIRDIGAALDYAHANGVIHRDVKPSNIMLRGDDRAVLTDFGLALDVPEGTQGGTFGSAHYIAPEQAISSSNAVPQSDLYSLGVVLYQMMTGKVPFDDSSAMSVALKHLSDAPPPPRLVDPTITPNVEKVILRALEKEPSKRYKTGAALYEALADAMGLIDTGSRPSRLFPPVGLSEMGTNPSPKRSTRETQPVGAAFPADPSPTNELDSSINDARRTILMAQDAQDRARRRPIILGAIGLLVIIGMAVGIAAIVLNNSGGGGLTPTIAAVVDASTDPAAGIGPTEAASETASPSDEPTLTTEPTATDPAPIAAVTDEATAASAVTDEPTATDSPTEAPSDAPTDSASVTPSVTPSDAPSDAPSETSSPSPSDTATRRATLTPTPSERATATPTDTPVSGDTPLAVTPTSDGPTITLRYNPDYLVLYNTSGGPVDVSNWTFERLNSTSVFIRYQATTWQTGFLDRLPAGDCLMLWRIGIREVDPPDYCRINRAWFAVGQPRYFWVSSAEGATFDVLRGLRVLATCPTNDGECVVPLDS